MNNRAAHDRARASGLALGLILDSIFADPQRFHPVAGFGRVAAAVEKYSYRDTRTAGALHTSVLVGGVVLGGALVSVGARRRGGAVAESVMIAGATWAALGGTSLSRTGTRMAGYLSEGDLDSARMLLPSLCGRDPSILDNDGLCRASLESLAENTSDAAVGVVVWGALGGVPAILGYRAVNTLDAMIGYRSAKYSRFGWFAARLDDVVNILPARICGALTVLIAPAVGGYSKHALRAWKNDAARHPSPNAGVAEATAAGALGVSLGGRTEYAHGVEIRPRLGDGRSPTPVDLRRAARLSTLVQVAATAVSVTLAVAVGQTRVVRR